jgi:hypothetical protein
MESENQTTLPTIHIYTTGYVKNMKPSFENININYKRNFTKAFVLSLGDMYHLPHKENSCSLSSASPQRVHNLFTFHWNWPARLLFGLTFPCSKLCCAIWETILNFRNGYLHSASLGLVTVRTRTHSYDSRINNKAGIATVWTARVRFPGRAI